MAGSRAWSSSDYWRAVTCPSNQDKDSQSRAKDGAESKWRNPLYIDVDGDLRLQVGAGDEQATLVVCSRALARASPVFKRMLFGGFAESKPAHGEWLVNLPEDMGHIDGLIIVMDIIHGNTYNLDMDLSRHSNDATTFVFDLAVIADKYDVVRVLNPWAEAWLRTFYEQGKWNGCLPDHDGWRGEHIWAAWVFGDEKRLRDELGEVLLSLEMKKVSPASEECQV